MEKVIKIAIILIVSVTACTNKNIKYEYESLEEVSEKTNDKWERIYLDSIYDFSCGNKNYQIK